MFPYNAFSVFFNRYLFSPITGLYFDSCNLCKKKPLSLKRFIGLRLFISRSSRLQMLYNRYIFRKIYDKTRVSWSLFHKVAELEPATVLKRRLQNRVFPCEFFEKSRSNFLENTCERLNLFIWNKFQRRKLTGRFAEILATVCFEHPVYCCLR